MAEPLLNIGAVKFSFLKAQCVTLKGICWHEMEF